MEHEVVRVEDAHVRRPGTVRSLPMAAQPVAVEVAEPAEPAGPAGTASAPAFEPAAEAESSWTTVWQRVVSQQPGIALVVVGVLVALAMAFTYGMAQTYSGAPPAILAGTGHALAATAVFIADLNPFFQLVLSVTGAAAWVVVAVRRRMKRGTLRGSTSAGSSQCQGGCRCPDVAPADPRLPLQV